MLRGLLPPPGPVRLLAVTQLVCRIGDGAYYVCAALFFTRIAGLTPVQMGLGLTIGWTVALVLSVPLGHLADRRGPRGTATVLLLCAAAAVSSYVFITDFLPFVVIACVYAVSQRGASAAEQAMVAGLMPENEVVRTRAFVQSAYNAGLAVGAGIGGIVLVWDTAVAYYAAFLLNAVAFLAAAWITRFRLPHVAPHQPVAAGPAPKGGVLRDRPYIAMTALNTLLLLHIPLVDIALPLWIVTHTAAPIWLLSVMFILNTVAVVLFQVRVSRGADDVGGSTRHVVRGALLLALSCVVFAFTSVGDSAWVAGVLLVVATAVQTLGEMMQAAGSWGLSFGLAPDGKHGQYQAFFGNGITVAELVGPLALTGLIVYWGAPGWLLLGAIFVVASAAMVPAVHWGQRRRQAALVPSA